MRRTFGNLLGAVLLFSITGCTAETLSRTAKPVVTPIKKTTDTVFQERKIGSKDTAEAVLFPREEEEEQKQFKLKF
ncbi:MAG: hypothetical protein HY714_00660 [Candidatus Omnitrophica bacterium]|nr:hypothetical protein [Candidatus Omnitrophota bacterium]